MEGPATSRQRAHPSRARGKDPPGRCHYWFSASICACVRPKPAPLTVAWSTFLAARNGSVVLLKRTGLAWQLRHTAAHLVVRRLSVLATRSAPTSVVVPKAATAGWA